MQKKVIISLTIAGAMCLLSLIYGCKKETSFLDEKPDESLQVPSTLTDYQSLLKNENVFNKQDPALGTLAAGEYNVTTSIFNSSYTLTERNSYIWNKEIYQGEPGIDWNGLYQQVYYANVVLDGLARLGVPPGQETLYNQVKGTALFFRSYAFFNLVQTFALPYNTATATTDLGIPLRLTSDLNVKSTRATEQQCYDQIFQDLNSSLSLLPSKSSFITQPNITVTNALLARIYLSIGNYSQAYKYANNCLSQNNTLVDYNSLTSGTYTLIDSNAYLSEDIYHTDMNNYGISSFGSARVDTAIYQMYNPNDLRKTLFFTIYNGMLTFKGSYGYVEFGTFSGLATDEVYLIRSECNARLGNIPAAVSDLNTLLVNRFKKGTFTPYSTSLSSDQLLTVILNERIKELYYRGLRWTDLRRLNQDNRFKVTLTRSVNGNNYSLPPNDPRYAYPIPDQEIQLSGIQQNQR